MNEIKFSCPLCSQHIACDELYCCERIDCPGCGGVLFIPSRAAFIPQSVGNLAVALPVASKQRQYPRSPRLDVWTEERWEQHASESGVHKPSLLPLWILLFLPFVVAMVLAMHRAGVVSIECLFVLCALLAGFYLAKIQNHSVGGTVVMGVVYSFAMLFVYMVVACSLLFVGCLIAIA